MKEQIKQIRVKIDGLSQLVKDLKTKKTQVNIALKTKQETIDDFLTRVESEKLGVEIIEQSEQIKKCYDSLILAKAWLGKVLGKLGESTPYANDGNRKTVDDIEPTADTLNKFKVKSIGFNENVDSTYIYYNLSKENWDMFNYIEKVDWLRQEIQMISNQYKDFVIPENNKYFVNLFIDKSYCYLAEARFWLGFELKRIRESSTHNI